MSPPSAFPAPPAVTFQRALVIANPVSGRGQAARAGRELAEGLNQRGIPAELFLTSAKGDAFSRLRADAEGPDLVVSVGGDGTLREVFEGLLDPEVPVAVLPFGTANVLALELGLSRNVPQTLEMIEAGRVTAIDVSQVNGHLSFLVVGVGLDGMTVRDVEERRDGPITKWTYVGAVARTLKGYRPPRLRLELDGEALEGEYGFVVASNVHGYGGLLQLDRGARIDDGLLEVYLFPTGTRRELVAAALRGMIHHLPGGAVGMRRARHIRVEAEEPVPYQVDGDLGGTTPVELEVGPRQYHLLVP